MKDKIMMACFILAAAIVGAIILGACGMGFFGFCMLVGGATAIGNKYLVCSVVILLVVYIIRAFIQ